MQEPVFNIRIFPAQRGDTLWIEYGSKSDIHRILIDAGIASTARETLIPAIKQLPAGSKFDLVMVTHIDLDHIEGMLVLLNNMPTHVVIDQIWFNGPPQLTQLEDEAKNLEALGVPEGNELAKLLKSLTNIGWNKCVSGKAIQTNETEDSVGYELPGGMTVTVLSPSLIDLKNLKERWPEAMEELELKDTPNPLEIEVENKEYERLGPMDRAAVEALSREKFEEDGSFTNASSIAVKLEFEEKTALMLADAHPSVSVR